ncbi:hypothetical protein V6L77_24200 [Pannonibacter sp. Pt2-lr]
MMRQRLLRICVAAFCHWLQKRQVLADDAHRIRRRHLDLRLHRHPHLDGIDPVDIAHNRIAQRCDQPFMHLPVEMLDGVGGCVMA